MLNSTDINTIFNVSEKIDRAILAQAKTKSCVSLIRDKLILRYPFNEAILNVREEITHKIYSENPSLIKDTLSELSCLIDNLKSYNSEYFADKVPSDIIPNYMLLLSYIGIAPTKSKIFKRIKNIITVTSRFASNKINLEKLKAEFEIQLVSFERKIQIYKSSDEEDIIIFILRYDIKK